MARESPPQSKAKGKVKRLTRERRRLSDSVGAWKMSAREEERMFSGLKKQWKNTTLAIRTTAELAGSGKKHADLSEMKRLLDRMRAEDDDQKVDELVESLLKLKKAGKEPIGPSPQTNSNWGRSERKTHLQFAAAKDEPMKFGTPIF